MPQKLNGNYTLIAKTYINFRSCKITKKQTFIIKRKTKILDQCEVQCSKYAPFDRKNHKQALSPGIVDKN